MPRASLHDLFINELRDLYSGEAQLLKTLPRLARAADAKELRAAFDEHLAVTRGQVERLDALLAGLGEKTRGTKCQTMACLIDEAKEALGRDAHPVVRDVALIAVGQKVAHIGMAGYECARTYARLLGDGEAADHLQDAMDEEAEADVRLSELAQTVILVEAEEGEDQAKPVATKVPKKKAARRH
jgi:ferritin-like metal-binding protein YciE